MRLKAGNAIFYWRQAKALWRPLLIFGILGTSFLTTSAPARYPQDSQTKQPTTSVNRWANLADTVFQHLNTDNGIPQGIVTAMAQDADGFIWFGTQGGLARWDGYRVRVYQPDSRDTTSLPDNYIMSLHLDQAGRLWVGTNSSGMAQYDRNSDSFIRLPLGPHGLSHVTVNAIADDGKDALWIATRGGLDHYDIASKTFTHFRHEDKNPTSLPSDIVRALLVDRSGKLWLGTSAGLVSRNANTGQFSALPLPRENGKTQRISALEQSDNGDIWIGTNDAGSYVLHPNAPAPVALTFFDSALPKANASNDFVYDIKKVSPQEVWIGTYGQGIVVVNTETGQAHRLLHDGGSVTSLADNSIWAILRDRAGLVWVGNQRGISRHDPTQKAVLTLFGNKSINKSLDDIDYLSALTLPNGDIWLGGQNKGINIISDNTNQVRLIPTDDSSQKISLPRGAVQTMVKTPDNQVLIGLDKGLFLTDVNASFMRQIDLSPRNVALRVITVLLDGEKLYLGGPDGFWEKTWTTAAESEKLTLRRPVWAEVVKTKYVLDIKKAPDGAIWVSTLHDGLFRFEPENASYRQFSSVANDKDTLSHNNVCNMYFDTRGWLWAATQGGGLNVLKDPTAHSQGKILRLGKAQGLPNELVGKILEDAAHNIWVSSDEGIAKIDVATFKISAMQKAEGVAINGYWSNSGSVTEKGELIFGGVGGLTIVRPQSLQNYDYHPPIVVTNIHIGGKLVAANHARFTGKAAQSLQISPDANSLVVEFAALDFSAPERNRYSYKLEGYDKNWIDSDTSRRLAAYTNLSPGHYRLHLRGSNRDGSWTEQELVIAVEVLPAWFQTWWAYTLYVLSFSAAVYSLIRWRLWSLKNQNRQLEMLVRERTHELELSRQKLEQQSFTDPLTGLRNRRYLSVSIEADVAQVDRAYQDLPPTTERSQSKRDMIFLLVDIDQFKSVNDDYGHAAGDLVLIQVAEILRSCTRDSDTIIRWGGEEFLIVARQSNYVEGEAIAERIRCQIAQHEFDVGDGLSIRRTCSIGFASYPFNLAAIHAYPWEQVIAIADQCLYAAKRAGRNTWVEMLSTDHDQVPNDAQQEHKTHFDAGQAIRERKVIIKSSLADSTQFDWSHGHQHQ